MALMKTCVQPPLPPTGNTQTQKSHSPQYTQTHLPILVEVRVESDHTPSCGHELHSRGLQGVVGGESDDKMKQSPFIRGVEGAGDDRIKLCTKENCIMRHAWFALVNRNIFGENPLGFSRAV